MQKVQANAQSIRQVLDGQKYQIDYYQREYRWEKKQVTELIDDLTESFLSDYRPDHRREDVAHYGHYFLGSVLMSYKEDGQYIVDGQQRLTSLTLLLIYLRNLQKSLPEDDRVGIDGLVLSVKHGNKSFNLNVPERTPILEALWQEKDFDTENASESVRNISTRYEDIKAAFPYGDAESEVDLDGDDEDFDESVLLDDHAIPYFIDWLIDSVYMVVVTAFSDNDAYTIFEAMNDRGLSLTPTDMLKGYLLANITQEDKRKVASDSWKSMIQSLNNIAKDTDADFFKAWLRSQYAKTIRDRKKGARPRDYDLIGTEFHRWVKDQSEALGLKDSTSHFNFIYKDMSFYSKVYETVTKASENLTPGLESIRYNAQLGFTLQNMMLLAPLRPSDSHIDIRTKLRIVSLYIDILLNYRQWNFKAITHSGMQYSAFITMTKIRDLTTAGDLADYLYKSLLEMSFNLDSNPYLRLHGQNGRYIKALLARLTDYVEMSAGNPSHFDEYMVERSKNRYEIEHIWANHFEDHDDEFNHASEFQEYRNRLGGLLIVPKKFNASYGDLPYKSKVPHYLKQNLLARSLHPNAYTYDPGFNQFIAASKLSFKPHESFKKLDLDARQDLYREIAKQIWNPQRLLDEVTA